VIDGIKSRPVEKADQVMEEANPADDEKESEGEKPKRKAMHRKCERK
jgi:hypothetical protein